MTYIPTTCVRSNAPRRRVSGAEKVYVVLLPVSDCFSCFCCFSFQDFVQKYIVSSRWPYFVPFRPRHVSSGTVELLHYVNLQHPMSPDYRDTCLNIRDEGS